MCSLEFGEKLKELNMTGDEIERLTKAFKDDKFKEMLRDYAEEISDPENKRKYEEEIKMLEQERGNNIEFIHPTPFRALKTSVNGTHKCFINICGNEKVGKPEYKCGVSEDGRRGQCWALPHSLHPGREDRDPKGNKIMIYDVIFHPDTLHIASKNKKFVQMVDSTAIQQIEKVFKVTLDKNNMREMKIKYKGTPEPCVIRKPIPGYKAKSVPEKPDPFAFPYPDETRPTTFSQTKPTEPTATIGTSAAEPESFQIQRQTSKEPTQPSYTIKYRTVVDLQDFRCSRDSAQSPRPKEIVVTIDLPLLKSVTHASLEVQEKSLLLETKKPAYRLDLPLAYPVDEEKGEAKFNKQRGQLTVTLPVIPSKEDFPFALGSVETVSDVQSVSEWQGKNSGDEEDVLTETEMKRKSNEEKKSEVRGEMEKVERKVEEEEVKHQSRHDNEEGGCKKGEGQMSNTQDIVKEKNNVVGVEENLKKQNRNGQASAEEESEADERKNGIYESGEREEKKQKEPENELESEQLNSKKRKDGRDDNKMSRTGECDCAENVNNSLVRGFHKQMDLKETKSVTLNDFLLVSPKTECESIQEDRGVSLESSKIKIPNVEEEKEKTEETVDSTLEAKADAAPMNLISTEEPQTSGVGSAFETANVSVSSQTEEFSQSEVNEPNTETLDDRVSLCSEEPAVGPAKQEEKDNDEDAPSTKENTKPPPVVLREIDEDGNEKIISDHSTTAGFNFQNTMMFELD